MSGTRSEYIKKYHIKTRTGVRYHRQTVVTMARRSSNPRAFLKNLLGAERASGFYNRHQKEIEQ